MTNVVTVKTLDSRISYFKENAKDMISRFVGLTHILCLEQREEFRISIGGDNNLNCVLETDDNHVASIFLRCLRVSLSRSKKYFDNTSSLTSCPSLAKTIAQFP